MFKRRSSKLSAVFMPALICLSLVLAVSGSNLALADAQIGAAAPQFTLTDSNGVKHSLADFKGKFVVLEWWNPDCPYVVKHYSTKNMQGLQDKYTQKGVVWLTINSSAPDKQGHLTPSEANELVKERGIKSTAVLFDPDGSVGKAYGARTTPHMFVISPDQKLIYAGAIDDNSSSRPSTIAGAKNYVAAALDAGMSGNQVAVSASEPYGCSVKYAG